MKAALAIVIALCAAARADSPDAKRKVVVLEYRSGSSALPNIVTQLVAEIAKQTSLQVLGPEQTKTLYGEKLDDAIVKCAGEAVCVAKIGQKVGAAEVILIGISELGDVILTMQRINVESHRVDARIADSLTNKAAPTAAQLREFVSRLLPPSDFLQFGIIAITANESGAAVNIGGEPRGVTPIAPLKLRAPASYNIRLVKHGFVPYTTKVQLAPNSEINVEAMLSHHTGAHWYQKWYVLTGIAIGIGLVGGGVYLETRTPPDTVSVHGVFK